MKEQDHFSQDQQQKPEQQQFSRRELLKLLPPATLATAAAVYHWRQELREAAKNILDNFPHLYQQAALMEEYALKLAGMPVKVELYSYQEDHPHLEARPSLRDAKQVTNAQEAIDFFHKFPVVDLENKTECNQQTGAVFNSFYLPASIGSVEKIKTVLGVDVTTPHGESLPHQAVAMQVILPEQMVPVVAPAVPIPGRNNLNPATDKYHNQDYYALNLPQHLLSQTVISLGHQGSDKQIVPNAHRMVIAGQDVRGQGFAQGAIEAGGTFLWADGSDWGLSEWPNNRLQEENTSCLKLFWVLNPHSLETDQRIFNPRPKRYFAEQATQQHGFINHKIVGADYEQIGPTAVFRTDQLSLEKDIIFISPFLPLAAPHIFKNIILTTPIGRSTTISHPDHILAAMPDAKYNTMYGYHPGLLYQGSIRTSKPHEIEDSQGEAECTDFFSINNSLAFYVGIA